MELANVIRRGSSAAQFEAHGPQRLMLSDWLDHDDDAFGRHVYCAVYPTGTHTKDYYPPAGFRVKATNKSLQSSGEIWSVLWNPQMKVKHVTVGYPINAHR